MTGRNVVLILAVSLGMAAFQATATASEQKVPDAHWRSVDEAGGRSGVINRIDVENGQLVIDDLKYGFFPQQLIVRKSGHISSLKALRPNQRVRYSNKSRVPGEAAGNRIISEIWVE